MKRFFNQDASGKLISGILFFVMMISMTLMFTSCGDDEPEKGGDENSVGSIVTATDLEGSWTLVKNRVLYSETGSGKSDETIDFSGNSAPYYRYYKVTLTDDGMINFVETSATGRYVGDVMQFELKNDQLLTKDGEVAATVQNYNPGHSWDNLRVKWTAEYSPVSYGAPVVSTYML